MLYRVMNINDLQSRLDEFHVLTYAEEGFAPLNQHTNRKGVSKAELVSFAKLVNEMNQVGTLYPRVALSAVPRHIIRDAQGPSELSLSISEFYRINAGRIGAKRVLLDFRAPDVEQFVYVALEMSLESPAVSFIEEIVVLDDDASHRPRHI
jgi:hypothetical protein